MKNYLTYDVDKRQITLHDLSIEKLKSRIAETYTATSGYKQIKASNINKLFNSMDYITWENTEIKFYTFFAVEVYELFADLADQYNDRQYADVAEQIYRNTWISNQEKEVNIQQNLLPLTRFNLKPKDFQLEFIKKYPILKFKYDLDGYILSFEQGLGKTFTSIALAECLGKEHIYIVCPNALKENWADEIHSYFKKYNNNEELWKSEVCIVGSGKFRATKNSKYFIINQESIPNIYKYVDPNKNNMIIVDESHNFRGLHIKRTEALIQLKELAKSHDVLLMSGTPIKAIPNEITPSLRLIDPHFTAEFAEKYFEIFSDKSSATARIAKGRFKRVIYRKLKSETYKLPDKLVTNMNMKIPHEDRFGVTKIKNIILKEFHEDYLNRLRSGIFTKNRKSPFFRDKANDYDWVKTQRKFESIVRTYSRAHPEKIEEYLNYIFQRTEDNQNIELINSKNIEEKYFTFLKNTTIPFVPKEEKAFLTTDLNGLFGWALAAKSASASAIGKVFAEYKNMCFQEIWKYNTQEFLNMIRKNPEKTIIFTSMVPTANYIYESLIKNNIGAIEIIGDSLQKSGLVKQFREDDSIKVLVATNQTLGNGFTLTEATQVLFFGTPYRSVDFDQAVDRIHRLGQTKPVYVYNILLYSREKNITHRIEEILNWSSEMFDSLINESQNFEEI